MAARLQAILAHLGGLTPVGVSADSFVARLMSAVSTGGDAQLKVGTLEWTEDFARGVLDRLATTIQVTGYLAGPVYDKAVEGAHEIGIFKENNPVWFTVIALGMLAIICPLAIKALGFPIKALGFAAKGAAAGKR